MFLFLDVLCQLGRSYRLFPASERLRLLFELVSTLLWQVILRTAHAQRRAWSGTTGHVLAESCESICAARRRVYKERTQRLRTQHLLHSDRFGHERFHGPTVASKQLVLASGVVALASSLKLYALRLLSNRVQSDRLHRRRLACLYCFWSHSKWTIRQYVNSLNIIINKNKKKEIYQFYFY